ncbi:50S ribosomal protein L6 [Brumimicrobium glaciale]|jgi:large subunit ribosomal protein L6|uniref:Large ribosomal subunit protein uL6 n=1 Tax=Brumimicrobium glaciale TaxID=200475 RepID=A0A4Q4KH85_9FLAO|nr:50S ribosomal protein L6 [Brumimicrobium glaciale]RYM32475.1 50S ribosomal protein L6 [Brumimicrobium glaciale]
MSRIGKSPVSIPSGVEIKMDGQLVTVKGPKGEITHLLDPEITAQIENDTITFNRASDAPATRAKHGLSRSLVSNMVQGVSEGFKKVLEVIGVGFRAEAQGQMLTMSVGHSHPIVFEIPQEVKVSAETAKGKPPVVTLESFDKQLLGHVAAKVRSFRKPEPYKGKGIRFQGEYVRRKAGKAAGK